MAFEQLADLDCETTISLGGRDKESGKKNPTSFEGYYIGFRLTEGKFGPSKLHIFQTEQGNVGVWGKTNMDSKLAQVTPGKRTRVTFTGEVPSNKGNPMKKFKVEVDKKDFIEVSTASSTTEDTLEENSDYSNDASELEESDIGAEDDQLDEAPPARAKPPARIAQAPSAESQRRVQELLSGKNRKTA